MINNLPVIPTFVEDTTHALEITRLVVKYDWYNLNKGSFTMIKDLYLDILRINAVNDFNQNEIPIPLYIANSSTNPTDLEKLIGRHNPASSDQCYGTIKTLNSTINVAEVDIYDEQMALKMKTMPCHIELYTYEDDVYRIHKIQFGAVFFTKP